MKMKIEKNRKNMRQPGIEPGSTAWKAAMLTIIPLTLTYEVGPGSGFLHTGFQRCRKKGHCRDQDSNLGYCGHNAGS